MDNRINEIRRKISVLRAEMVRVENTMRDQIRHDLDSTESALRLMDMRKELAALVTIWRAAGGSDPLPTIEERLKASYRPAQKPKNRRAQLMATFARGDRWTAIWFCSIATSPGSGATSGSSPVKSSS
jgi:hypothetical protein